MRQEHLEHQICEEKNTHAKGKEWKMRSHHIKEKKCQCLSRVLQQTICAEDQCDEVEHDFDKSESRTNTGDKNDDEEEEMREIL